MRLHVYTLDEREAMNFRKAGWKFKRLEGSEWELIWDTRLRVWPDDPRQEEKLKDYRQCP